MDGHYQFDMGSLEQGTGLQWPQNMNVGQPTNTFPSPTIQGPSQPSTSNFGATSSTNELLEASYYFPPPQNAVQGGSPFPTSLTHPSAGPSTSALNSLPPDSYDEVLFNTDRRQQTTHLDPTSSSLPPLTMRQTSSFTGNLVGFEDEVQHHQSRSNLQNLRVYTTPQHLLTERLPTEDVATSSTFIFPASYPPPNNRHTAPLPFVPEGQGQHRNVASTSRLVDSPMRPVANSTQLAPSCYPMFNPFFQSPPMSHSMSSSVDPSFGKAPSVKRRQARPLAPYQRQDATLHHGGPGHLHQARQRPYGITTHMPPLQQRPPYGDMNSQVSNHHMMVPPPPPASSSSSSGISRPSSTGSFAHSVGSSEATSFDNQSNSPPPILSAAAAHRAEVRRGACFDQRDRFPIPCKWGACTKVCEGLQSFHEHLQEHKIPVGHSAKKVIQCEWRECSLCIDEGHPGGAMLSSSSVRRHIVTELKAKVRCKRCNACLKRDEAHEMKKHLDRCYEGYALPSRDVAAWEEVIDL